MFNQQIAAVASLFLSILICPIGHARPLNVTLKIDPVIQIGEPVTVNISIKNNSVHDQFLIVPSIDRYNPCYTVAFHLRRLASNKEMTKIGNPDIYVGGVKMRANVYLPVMRLSANAETTCRFDLMYDFPSPQKRQLLFNTAGKYEILAKLFSVDNVVIYKPIPSICDSNITTNDRNYVRCDCVRDEIVSPIATFDICEHTNKNEQTAFDALKTLPDEYLLYSPWSFTPEYHKNATAALWTYHLRHQNTILGQRAALPLGVAYLRGCSIEKQGERIIEFIESLASNSHSPLSSVAQGILDVIKQQQTKPGFRANYIPFEQTEKFKKYGPQMLNERRKKREAALRRRNSRTPNR